MERQLLRPVGDQVPWRDPALPPERRVADLLSRMTLEEKVAQLYGVWLGAADADGEVAPHQHEPTGPAHHQDHGIPEGDQAGRPGDAQAPLAEPLDWGSLIRSGLGQLTRPFGTAPVDPAQGARALARRQAEIVAAGRHGIPALAHEECLAGFATWGATIFPVPLAWGASFDPELVEEVGRRVGASMASVGVHQGLAPVLDVVRDHRWGRVEETIGEDPYLVGTIGTAYVRGLQAAGVVATPKHFVGYAASTAGRNQAPVSAGPRELADVLLAPFEMAVREGRARSLMHSYAAVDGVPPAADGALLTTLLREGWGFEGTVVADYFGVSFLELTQGVAGDPAEAAHLALSAGVDVELPAVRCYGRPLLDAVRAGTVPEALVERAARRVLLQKCQLGLLDPGWSPLPPALGEPDGGGAVDLDPPADRALARRLAEESVVLLATSPALPIPPAARVAVVGPRADDPLAMMGCYSFPVHVGGQHPGLPLGLEVPTLLAALRAELPAATVRFAPGCPVAGPDTGGFQQAVQAAREADVAVVALGDQAGMFGRGTSGEGSDAPDLRLPGVQGELLEAVLATGTPVVLVLLAGRPYALGAFADRLAGIVQAFFPGEEGGPAVAGVLSGRVNPSGRLPVGVPRHPGGQPGTYLAPPLGRRNRASSVDPTPLFPFGHGLSYTRFRWDEVTVDGRPPGGAPAEVATDGELEVALTVTNAGERAGAEVVQVYLHDPVAQVTRPVVRLVAYARVRLPPGRSRRVRFAVPADVSAFTGLAGHPVVEPGDLELRLSASSAHARHVVPVRLVGPERRVDRRRLVAAVLD